MGTRPVHPSKVKRSALLDFMHKWNEDSTKFNVTEKLDGFHFVYGRDETGYYTRTLTKSKKYYDADDYPDVFYMRAFRRYHIAFNGCTFPDEIGTFEITGEMIPTVCPNVIQYNADVIGRGIFQVLNVRFDKQIPFSLMNYPPDFYAAIHLSRNSGDIMVLPIDHANPFEQLRFRKTTIAGVEDESNDMEQCGNVIRWSFMTHRAWKSTFGEEVEGFVITGDLTSPIKIVDTDLFLKRKDENWRYMDMILALEKTSCRAVKEDMSRTQYVLDEWSDKLDEIEHTLRASPGVVPLVCKRQDTMEQILLSRLRLSAVHDLYDEMTPDAFSEFVKHNRLDRLT